MTIKFKVGLAIAGLLAAISFVQGVRNAVSPGGSQDFQWSGSRILLQRQDPYSVQLEALHHLERPSPFLMAQNPNYPASGLILLWPFARASWPIARLMWALLNVLFAVIIVVGLGQLFLYDKPWWWTFLLGCL